MILTFFQILDCLAYHVITSSPGAGSKSLCPPDLSKGPEVLSCYSRNKTEDSFETEKHVWKYHNVF